jgi:serine/threonine protein kinase
MPEELQSGGSADQETREQSTAFDLPEVPGIRLKSVISSQSAESDVWLGEMEDGSRVAVKIYRHGRIPGLLDDLKKRSLRHPNLLPVLKAGEAGGRYFEVSTFVTGPTLAQLLAEKVRLSESEAVDLVRQLSGAIHYLHTEQVLHRDVKPSNVFVTSREPFQLMLADFGTARLTAFQTMLTGSIGTVAYSSPEALTGLQSEGSDYWSVGIILMEALTGRRPFEGVDLKQQLYRVVSGQIEIPEGLSPPWERLLRGLLTADYTQRWRKKEIDTWLSSDEPIRAERPLLSAPSPQRARKEVREPVLEPGRVERSVIEKKLTIDEAFEVTIDFVSTYFWRYFWILFILPSVTRNSVIGWLLTLFVVLFALGAQFTPSALERHRRKKRVDRQLENYRPEEQRQIEKAAREAAKGKKK